MIHPATNVHVLSTEGGNNIEGAIESVIRIYSSIIDYHDINDGVDFSLILAQPNIGSKLKITDWTGWKIYSASNVISIMVNGMK